MIPSAEPLRLIAAHASLARAGSAARQASKHRPVDGAPQYLVCPLVVRAKYGAVTTPPEE